MNNLLLVWFRLFLLKFPVLILAAGNKKHHAIPSSASAWRNALSTATFIPPATPTIAPVTVVERRNNQWCAGPAKTCEQQHYAARKPQLTMLAAKKKKQTAAGGGAASKKMQVKLLKHVAGTGQAGQVVTVSPAFFQNKLRPSNSAVVISDEQVANEKAEADELAAQTKSKATELKEQLDDGFSLSVTRKAGPDGQLFGGVKVKAIMDELKAQLADEFLASKSVKITTLTDADGKKLRSDIKHTGSYGAKISLAKDITASFEIVVGAEA